MIKEQIEALKTADEYLHNFKKGIADIYSLINNDKEKEACNLIPYASEGLGWIIDVVNLTKDAQKEEIKINDIYEHIDAVVEAMENEDYILVGDLFNYEILPILNRVHEQMKKSIN